MAYSLDGTSQYIYTGTAVAESCPVTMSAWGRVVTGTSGDLMSLSDNVNDKFSLRLSATTSAIRAVQGDTQGAGIADTTAAPSLNAWSHGAAVMTSDSSRTAYLNGGNSATNATAKATPNTLNSTNLGVLRRPSIAAFFKDALAECAIWNVALTADEIASLAKGFKPTRIRPQSLVFYAPLVRSLQELRQGLALTNNNSATVADHPRVY